MKSGDLKIENLIENWTDTIGLTVIQIVEYCFNYYDDVPEFTIIHFSDGRFAIQRDQSYWTTTCGLICKSELSKHLNEVEQNRPDKSTTF
jgi:hypothetical protein